jgi:hypothetical protein
MPKKLNPSKLLQAIQFSEHLCNAKAWMQKAEELLAAAYLLEDEIRTQWAEIKTDRLQVVRTSGRTSIHGPYFLLIAFALENIFKAILIHRNNKMLRNLLLTSLPTYISDHDLIRLARKSEFPTSVTDQDLLVRLTRNSIWVGRYPVPTGPDGMRALEKYADGNIYLTAFYALEDLDRLRNLVDRACSFFLTEFGQGNS